MICKLIAISNTDCSEKIEKDYFRFGQEVDFRGNKS